MAAVRVQPLLKPRPPDDCPASAQQVATALHHTPACPPVPPWQPRYKRRGTSTRIITQGRAGLKYPCASCQIDDAGVQALLSAYVAVVASLGVPCFTR